MSRNGNGRGRKLPEVLSADEQVRLLAQADEMPEPGRTRTKTMLRLFLNTGLRISEIVALKLKDLDLETGKFWVREGKGGKDRGLCLSASDRELFREWLEVRPGPTNPQAPAFTSLDGAGRPVCVRWLHDHVKSLARRAGIVKKISPHSLRHSFASDLLHDTKNLFLVSKALGHADIRTTQVYLHLQDHELDEAMKNFRR